MEQKQDFDSSDSCAFNMLFTKSVPHILERIFLFLDYESFKECLNVSKVWTQLLTSESYLHKGKLKFQKEIRKDQCLLAFQAVCYGNIGRVQRLLSSGMLDINFILPNGTTALHQAVFQDHHDIVNLLIDRGADPNIGDRYEITPLHWAVETMYSPYLERKQIGMVKILLNRGADPNKMSKRWTPLHEAVQNGSKSTVQLLLDKGALPNLPGVSVPGGVSGRTAMEMAERRGNKEIIQLMTIADEGAVPLHKRVI